MLEAFVASIPIVPLTFFNGNGSFMARSQQPAGRKPATKFAQLRKKMEQNKVRSKVRTTNVRKSGNR
jgi:hypothetical protein